MKKSLSLLASVFVLSAGSIATVDAHELGTLTHKYVHEAAEGVESGKFQSAEAAAKALCNDSAFQASLTENIARHVDDDRQKSRHHKKK